MVAFSFRQRLTLSPAALAAIVAAGAVAAAMVALPTHVLESLAVDSGVAAFVPSAEPPLGTTARTLLAMLGGAFAGAAGWAVVTLLPRRSPPPGRQPQSDEETVPVLRRADAHPDAPPRAPLLATRDLGPPPFPPERAEPAPEPEPEPIERDLPRDLEAPLSAFDPGAIPEVPAVPVPPVAPLYRKPDLRPGERIETFELARPAPLPIDERPLAAPRTEATIQALLDRLEKGVTRRAEAAPEPQQPTSPAESSLQGLERALDELRRLAVRV
ncbi:hypothetical protein LZK98_08080 [Sphingomonas cannabina]|uniref:hypothetical protein n=1 Tax=Sphingomonas cannabina TaxID=2899123 RepID=UPI001F25C112|nr:hypothetical protein [Sphingomonas cannabina]UIJ46888.1 hypothetical protein LZK98_08080 [Sphingomonas cannabina]